MIYTSNPRYHYILRAVISRVFLNSELKPLQINREFVREDDFLNSESYLYTVKNLRYYIVYIKVEYLDIIYQY